MKSIVRTGSVLVGGLVAVLGFAPSARAGCVELPKPGAAFRAVMPGTGFAPFAAGGQNSAGQGPQIVGMWQFEFKSLGNTGAPFHIPDGATLDAGFAQWHSDGTEIMNSSRDPVTSSFCLGAWAHVSDRTYKLNHYALSWDNTGQLCHPAGGATNCFVGLANIREEVTVDPSGDTYEGTVTIDQYDTAQHVLFHLSGKVSAHRITAQ
jgi:hypothetical protein